VIDVGERKILMVNWIRICYPSDLNVVGCVRNFNILCINPECKDCEVWKVKEGGNMGEEIGVNKHFRDLSL